MATVIGKARALIVGAWDMIHPSMPDFRDLHVYGGGALLVIGAASVWTPLAYMTGGAVLLYLGLRK